MASSKTDVWVTNHRPMGAICFPPIFEPGTTLLSTRSHEAIETIPAGESRLIPADYWAEKSKEPIIKSWLDTGVLSVSSVHPSKAPTAVPEGTAMPNPEEQIRKVAPHLVQPDLKLAGSTQSGARVESETVRRAS